MDILGSLSFFGSYQLYTKEMNYLGPNLDAKLTWYVHIQKQLTGKWQFLIYNKINQPWHMYCLWIYHIP